MAELGLEGWNQEETHSELEAHEGESEKKRVAMSWEGQNL